MKEKEELMKNFKRMVEILKRNNKELQKNSTISNSSDGLYSIYNQNFDIIENIEEIVNELVK